MKNIPRYIGKLTIDRNEILERVKYYTTLQHNLRDIVRSYDNSNDAPNEIRRQIYENKILRKHYTNRLKDINKKIHLLDLKWHVI